VEFKICVLPGDGIGPEIIREAEKVLSRIEERFSHRIERVQGLIGGAAIEERGHPLPPETVERCLSCDAVLLGAVGGPKWDNVSHEMRPEQGLLGIRKALGVFANLRPARVFKELKEASCLRGDIVERGIDLLVIRELTGGIYFGEPKGIEIRQGERFAINTMCYGESEIRRIVRLAFEIARERKNRLCSVDKANVLDVSRLWREVVEEESRNYPDVELSHLYVDNAAMQLILDPSQFDVIVTSNLFGDILSDEAATITGSIGMLSSASLGGDGPGLYEPIHGSAPDIAGKDIANPIATILSVAMMFKYTFSLSEEAEAIERAVSKVLEEGYRTRDIWREGDKMVSCSQMGDLIVSHI